MRVPIILRPTLYYKEEIDISISYVLSLMIIVNFYVTEASKNEFLPSFHQVSLL